MAAPSFCSNCGRPLALGSTFCTNCGARVGAAGGPPPFAPPPLPYYAPQTVIYQPMAAVPSPATAATDRKALTNIQWAAVVSLVSAALSIVYLIESTVGQSLVRTNTTPGASALSVTIPSWFYLFLGGSALVELVTLVLLWLAFASLRTVDDRFRSPATLTLLAVIALPIAALGAALLLQGLVGTTCTNPTASNPGGCSFGAGVGPGIALVVVGAILALIGVIGGVLIGLWRVGTRYNQDTMHVAVILSIFPFLQIIGWILILVGVRNAMRASARPPGATF
jgi:hypothetical protein